MPRRTASALVLSLLAAPAVTGTAQAYVRGLNPQGAPFYWPSSCATVTIYLNGFTMMTSDEVAKSIAAAAHTWSPSEVTCPGPSGDAGSTHPYFEIIPSMSSGGPVPEIGFDGKNSIVFQTTSWDHDAAIIAATSHYSTPNGAIVDTDIEINAAVGSAWANLDPGSVVGGHLGDVVDLQTAITHEFGHFLGLAHTCDHVGVDPPAASTDDQGAPVPECPEDPSDTSDDGLPQAQAVMWYVVKPNVTAKRALSPDDIRAVCDLYPAAQDPHVCAANTPDDGCGCQTGGASPGAAGLLALAAATVLARRRRLRSDRDRPAAL